jgi:hypothetical protein
MKTLTARGLRRTAAATIIVGPFNRGYSIEVQAKFVDGGEPRTHST